MFLGGLAVTATADEGSLELNEQMIYDDGYQDDTLQNYGVKTLFSPEMESQNKKQKKQASAPVVELAGFKYLWSTLLFGIMAVLGSALGIYFTKRRVKRKESNSRWTNN